MLFSPSKLRDHATADRTRAFVAVAGAFLWIACRAQRSFEVELFAVLSLLFVLVVYPWHYSWYFVPAAALGAAVPPSRFRKPLRFAALALAFGWSLAYPAIEKKHSVLFQPFSEGPERPAPAESALL